MTALFTKVLDMSLTASVVILAVLAVRYCLRKAPKAISYALWAAVLFRLLCPVSLTAPLSVLEVTRPAVTATSGRTSSVSYLPVVQPEPVIQEAPALVRRPESSLKQPSVRKPEWDVTTIAAWVWMTGAAVMVFTSLISWVRLCRRLVGAAPLQKGVWLADHITTPFVLGIFRPKIYLPSDTPDRERRYILAHERHHIRRLDHIFKLLAYGALCLHWFNPLVWLAFVLAGKDMEMSCDEAVIRQLGLDIRAEYAQSLLRLATNRRMIAGIPLAFGEGDTKGRVKHMANWKKPKIWAVIAAVAVCILAMVFCTVNPGQEPALGATAPMQTEPAQSVPAPTAPTAATVTEPVTIGISIPSDTLDVEYGEGERRFFLTGEIPGQAGTQVIPEALLGGIRVYDAPEIGLTDMSAWLQALGVPQIVYGGYDYMASGSLDADLEVSFIDAGGRETKHYFYIRGESVFELWFDPSKLDDMTQAAIRESVYFAPDAAIQRTLPWLRTSEAYEKLVAEAENTEGSIYLQRCRDALEELQSRDSYTIKSHTNNYGGPILNDTSSYWFYKNGEDWLKLSQIPDEGFERGFCTSGFMCVDGKYYDNMLTYWDENEDILWGEGEYTPGALPWIARFHWEDQDVLYVSKVPAGKGMCITLQVMAPYWPENEDGYDFYQMQFIFNERVQLERVENTVFYHHETQGDYSSKETIQPVKDNWAATVIGSTYQQYLDQN